MARPKVGKAKGVLAAAKTLAAKAAAAAEAAAAASKARGKNKNFESDEDELPPRKRQKESELHTWYILSAYFISQTMMLVFFQKMCSSSMGKLQLMTHQQYLSQ